MDLWASYTVGTGDGAVNAAGGGRKKKPGTALAPQTTGEPPGPYAGYGGYGQGWGAGGVRINQLLPGARKDWLGAAGDLWRNSVVAACLGWLQDNGPSAVLEVKAVDKTPEGFKETVDNDHPLLDLLGPYGKPNQSYSQKTLWGALYLSYKVDGNAFIIPSRGSGGFGSPVELWWEPHWNVTPWRDINSSRLVDYYIIWRPTGRFVVAADDIIHLRDGIDPHNPTMGLSRLKSQARNIVGMNDAETYTASLVGNMGGIGVVWMPKEDTDVDEKQARGEKRRIQRSTRGENAGSVTALSLPGTIERIALSPQEMALESILDRPEATITSVIGVQAMSIGLAVGTNQRTFSNVKEADRMSWMNGLIPMQDGMLEDMGRQLLSMYGESTKQHVLRFNRTNVDALQRDAGEKATEAATLREKRITTQNESRAMIGLPPQEGGDKTAAEEDAEAQAQFEKNQGAMTGVGGVGDPNAPENQTDDYSDEELAPDDTSSAKADLDGDPPDDAIKASVAARREHSKRRAAQRHASRPGSASGPHGRFEEGLHPRDHGKFSSKPGGGGSATPASAKPVSATKKPASKRTSKAPGQKSARKIDRARRVKSATSHHLKGTTGKVGLNEKNHATAQEHVIAKALGAKAVGRRNGKDLPVDALKRGANGERHAIEVKTMMNGNKKNISVHADALTRKVNYAVRRPNRVVHTVVNDHRNTYNGGENKAAFSGHDLYYKRGVDAYKLTEMHKVKDHAELNRLVAMKDHELPAAARAGANWTKLTTSDRARATLAKKADKAHDSRLAKDLNYKARKRAEAAAA